MVFPRYSPGTTINNKGTTSSKLVSFADDTRVYSNIAEADDCNNLQDDLNSIYNWAVHNNMFFFHSVKFHYISFSSSLSSNSYNVYANPNMEIINPSDNVLDLCIFMSSNCSIEFHPYNFLSIPILAASDLIQALTLIIATFGLYSDFFITFDRSNWRRIIRDAMDGTHPKVL